MNIKSLINNLLVKKIEFNDLSRIKPVSNVFGFDRGTPVDRYYIDKFLLANKRFITGKVLEISESVYSRKYGSENVKIEVLHYDNTNPQATVVGDLTKCETLPSNEMDCFICTQTLNVIYDFKKAIDGAYYLLKENGAFLATVPGISQISRYDMDKWGDFWRFTSLSVKKLFEEAGFSRVDVTVYGNILASIALLQGVAIEDLPDIKLLDQLDNDYQVTIGIVAIK